MNGRGAVLSWFDGYVQRYRHEDPAHDRNFMLKAEHCRKVAAEALTIAKMSDWPADDIVAAELAGLLHDVGRFEQYQRYRTFLDRNSTDHAALAVAEIDQHRVLSHIPDQWQDPVRSAVRWHNARVVPPDVAGDALRLAQVVRDADKLDIFRVVIEYYGDPSREKNDTLELNAVDSPEISPQIASDILAGNTGDYRYLRTTADFRVLLMAWVHDMNTSCGLSEIARRGYLEKLYATMTPTPVLNDIYGSISRSLYTAAKRIDII